MTTPNACPTEAELQALASGTTTEARAEELEGHLLACPRCVRALRTLPAGDRVAAALQDRTAALPVPEGEEVESLVRRIRELATSLVETDSATLTVPPQDGAGADAAPTWAPGLAPPEGPGELGRLGPYRVLRVLGAGGMGVVYAAEDPQLQRTVALKVMKPDLAAVPAHRERFLREARAVARIEHDHIVIIHHVGEAGGATYLVMPLLNGETLQSRLKRDGRLPVAEVLRVSRETAAGLAAAHGHGLVHRDIKPANLWLDAQGRVKILDFGLARALSESVHLTGTNTVLGTPSFMAPEQAKGLPLDARSDLYSLGVVMYLAAGGRLPFPQQDMIALLTALTLETPAPVTAHAPDLPPAVADLIMQLLSRRPEDRPGSAAQVVGAIRAIEAGRDPAPRPARRRPVARYVVAAGVVAVVAAAAWFGPALFRGRTEPPDGPGGVAPPPVPAVVERPGLTYRRGEVRRYDGHTDTVSSVAFAGDGLRAASGSWDHTVRVWDLAGVGEVARFTGHTVTVRGVAISKAGDRVVSAGFDGTVRLWDAVNNGFIREANHVQDREVEQYFTGVALSPDGRRMLASCRDGSLRGWNANNGRPVLNLHDDSMGPLECLALSADGARVICGSQNGKLFLWKIDGEVLEKTLSGHSAWVTGVALSGDGRLALSGSSIDGQVLLWDLQSAAPPRALPLGGAVMIQGVALSGDGRLALAACSDGTVRVWSLPAGREVDRLTGHKGPVITVAVSPDGRFALTGGEDHSIRLWGLPPAD